MFGENAEQFRMFCNHVGIDYETLMTEPPTGRREVFKVRLTGKLEQYKKKTGRSMKALSDHLGWTENDYQWLRRIKANGVDHARMKKALLKQLTDELETTIDYLFGVTDAAVLPTWGLIINLGIEAFLKQQPEGSPFDSSWSVQCQLHKGK